MHAISINSSKEFGGDTQYNDSTKYMQQCHVVLCQNINSGQTQKCQHSVSLESISCEGPDSAVFRYPVSGNKAASVTLPTLLS